MPDARFWLYLLVMAGVTYLVRALPMLLLRRKLRNRFVLSFLHYIPYAVLTVMTVPACFYATGNPLSAAVGFVCAVVPAFFRRSLLTVALCAVGGVFACEAVMQWIVPLL